MFLQRISLSPVFIGSWLRTHFHKRLYALIEWMAILWMVHITHVYLKRSIILSPPDIAYMRQWTGPAVREWLVAYSAPIHYLNQCRNIVNLTLRNKFQRNFNQNINFSFTKMHVKISAKGRPCNAGRDELNGDVTQVRWRKISENWEHMVKARYELYTKTAFILVWLS